MAKIIWASDFVNQSTEYGRIAAELLHRLDGGDHEVIHFATNGINNSTPFKVNGIPVYGTTEDGNRGVFRDMSVVDGIENPDFWIFNFDVWGSSYPFDEIDFRYILYSEMNFGPISTPHRAKVDSAIDVIPCNHFSKNVISETLEGDEADERQDLIYPGVDSEKFHPVTDVPREERFGLSQDAFVVGIFDVTPDSRGGVSIQLRAFKHFIEQNNLHSEATLLIYSPTKPHKSSHLERTIDKMGLGDNVIHVDWGKYHFGVDDNKLNILYNSCDIILHTNSPTGFCLPILESFAVEIPVIGTGFAGMPELIDDDPREVRTDAFKAHGILEKDVRYSEDPFVGGTRGWIIPCCDAYLSDHNEAWRRTVRPEHIAATLTHAYDHPEIREEKGKQAREYVGKFDWDSIADYWREYISKMKDEVYKEDDLGIKWGEVGEPGDEKGNFAAFSF